ncbi:MAG: dihydropyrimidine dehydrogenase subunit PreA [Frankiaceae bacterium]|jgi:dihydroorotate dehydrogenase|nr:dihydropyrimidine dehydrogenase subunit PreA [Frankiaceae bacterium]
MNSTTPLEGLLRDLRRFPLEEYDSPAARELSAVLEAAPDTGELSRLGEGERCQLLHRLVAACVRARLQPLLSQNNIAHPVYNFLQSFEDNADGPWDREPVRYEGSQRRDWSLLGHSIRYPIGVPASVLTANHKWIRYFARRGYNVLTYKSVRSIEYSGHPFPHWLFIENVDSPWYRDEDIEKVTGNDRTWPKSFDAFSTANSFGVPSPPPVVWQNDVERSLDLLVPGQLLIVSVMGTAESTGTELVSDFARVARLAAETGVPAIELNLSCPNTVDRETNAIQEPVCLSKTAVASIVDAVKEVTDTPLVLKLSSMPKDRLADVVSSVAGKVQGVSGINTVQADVVNSEGDPVFLGTVHTPTEGSRAKAGVSGIAIREFGKQFVRWLDDIRKESSADFDIIGMGGVMNGHDVLSMRYSGAGAVQSATAAMVGTPLPEQAEHLEEIHTAVLNSLGDGLWLDKAQIVSLVGVTPSVASVALDALVEAGKVTAIDDGRGRSRYSRN